MNKRLRIAILERDGYRCVYCGRGSDAVELQVDHVEPRATGGSDDAANLVTACFDCNNGKRDNVIRLPAHVTPAPVRGIRRRGSRPAQETSWLAEADRRYPDDTDLAWITGDGRWATVSWCAGLTVALHSTAEKATRALAAITDMFCGHGCWGDHQIIDLSVPEPLFEDLERDRGTRRANHYQTCPTCRYLSSGSGNHAAIERMSSRCLKAGKQHRAKERALA